MRGLAAWVVAVFVIAAVQHVLWHWPARAVLKPEDKLVRGSYGVLMLIAVALGVYLLAVQPVLSLVLLVGLIVLGVVGTCVDVGYTVLLWKFRFHRDTAAISTAIGELDRPDEEDFDG